MKMTTKKLEIFFIIVYFGVAFFCITLNVKGCFIASLAGGLVGIMDWYAIKFMSIRWLNRGGYSFFENSLRYIFVGFSVWILFELHLNILGVILGLSVVPISLVIISIVALFKKISL